MYVGIGMEIADNRITDTGCTSTTTTYCVQIAYKTKPPPSATVDEESFDLA